MENNQDNQKPKFSTNEGEKSQNYEAPEVSKHEALRDITAIPTQDYGSPGQ